MTDQTIMHMEIYGEPSRRVKPDEVCQECEQGMYGGEKLIRVNGKWMCEECFKAYMEKAFSLAEMAEMMGFSVEVL